ncbi:hypothetical protein AB0J94_25605 [Micromonospora noduli]|uniref:hypothetical protein n=1 Tax=Micromonospora noduli TaxID=709876 RepID=UPI000DC52210|nr:hypothetical protein [Micromonospora noduli]KAB1928205.1 hypothetical protein F8280_03940 [Micromonospora noduli]RAO07960.1 hypothetical protein LUPAC07_05890 [Micromonospora noduli]
MERLLEAVWGTSSVGGRLVTSVVLIVLSVVLAGVAGRLATLRVADTSNRYYLRKAVHYLTVVVLLFALALLWQPFAGRIGVVVGLLAAGLALAMQESKSPGSRGPDVTSQPTACSGTAARLHVNNDIHHTQPGG